jgi:hypothetical protein
MNPFSFKKTGVLSKKLVKNIKYVPKFKGVLMIIDSDLFFFKGKSKGFNLIKIEFVNMWLSFEYTGFYRFKWNENKCQFRLFDFQSNEIQLFEIKKETNPEILKQDIIKKISNINF